MRLLAHEPFPNTQFARDHGVTLVPFEQLLRESDYLTLHIPLLPESRQVINRKTLALMKPTAFLINTARGGLVNEADLAEALRTSTLPGRRSTCSNKSLRQGSPFLRARKRGADAARRRR